MDARELAKLFTSLDVHLMEHEILLVIEEIDDSGDQTIDFDELLDWMQEKVWAGYPLLSALSGREADRRMLAAVGALGPGEGGG